MWLQTARFTEYFKELLPLSDPSGSLNYSGKKEYIPRIELELFTLGDSSNICQFVGSERVETGS